MERQSLLLRLRKAGLTEEVASNLVELFGIKEEEMGITDRLREQGFTPKVNEDFPAIKGEYKAKVVVARIEKTEGVEDRFYVQAKISQTFSGDTADNRILMRSYRFAGEDFNGKAVTQEDVDDALKALANDAKTLGVDIRLDDDQALKDSFTELLEKEGFIRAWHFTPKDDATRTIQQWKWIQEKNLGKDGKATKAGTTSTAPF